MHFRRLGATVDDVDNAVKLAKTPNWDRLNAQYPTAFLQASEEFVGLPKGQMGNSEVGHMNLGAGRVVMQSLPKIDAAINNGILSNNKNIKKFINDLKKSNGTAHIMGLNVGRWRAFASSAFVCIGKYLT